MSQRNAISGLFLLATGMILFLTGCATEISPSIQSGAAAGLAVHGQKLVTTRQDFAVANEQLTLSGPNFYRMDTAIPRDNRYFFRNDFVSHCMPRCEATSKPGYDQRFCHSYCSCAAEEFRNNVPLQHLMAFGLGQTSASQPTINRLIGMCAKEGRVEEQQPPRHELLPTGNPQSNTSSSNTGR